MTARRKSARRGRRKETGETWSDVVVAIVRDGERVVVMKRPEGAHLGGFDEFPGGRREGKETLEEACSREVREETGLAVTVGRKLAVGWHADAERKLALTFFECVLAGSSEIPAELATKNQARWVARQELAQLRFPPANRDVVRRLLEEPPAGAVPATTPAG